MYSNDTEINNFTILAYTNLPELYFVAYFSKNKHIYPYAS